MSDTLLAEGTLLKPPQSGTYVPLRGAADVIAPAATGVAATDRANLLTAIGQVAAGGRLFIPSGRYKIDQPLVVTTSMTIEGNSLTEAWLPTSSGGHLGSPNSPYLNGTVIEQQTAATDVLQLSGSATVVHLKNLGLTFASAILNSNTGHGVNATPSITTGGGHDTGRPGLNVGERHRLRA